MIFPVAFRTDSNGFCIPGVVSLAVFIGPDGFCCYSADMRDG